MKALSKVPNVVAGSRFAGDRSIGDAYPEDMGVTWRTYYFCGVVSGVSPESTTNTASNLAGTLLLALRLI